MEYTVADIFCCSAKIDKHETTVKHNKSRIMRIIHGRYCGWYILGVLLKARLPGVMFSVNIGWATLVPVQYAKLDDM